MVKKTTTTKKRSTTKTARATTARRKTTPVRRTASKVDYYPNRMGLAIAALASVSLLLLGMLAVIN